MTRDISIKYDGDGRIINRYIGLKDSDSWTLTNESDWPSDESGPDEVPQYYFNPDTDEISIQYRQLETPNDA
jgi:hypothetical protein